MTRPSLTFLLVLAASVAYLAGLIWLDRLDARGPPHEELRLEGGTPATLYLPGGEIGAFALPPPGDAERPPVVVLLHGYSGDRILMSGLARSLARAGFAVLTPDLRGHGANRRRLADEAGPHHHFARDLRAALRFVRASRRVDGSRVALAGHSMGARAALAHATRHARLDAVVLIAGGWEVAGPERPRNALFIHAERDLPSVPRAAKRLVSMLAGVENAEAGRIYGEHSSGTAVRRLEISGTTHTSVVRSDAAFVEIVDWLDRTWGVARAEPAHYSDPRPPAALLAFVGFWLLLPGLGVALGRLAPAGPESVPPSGVRDLLPLAAALVVALPVFAVGSAGVLLGASDADRQVSYLALVGLPLLGGLLATGRLAIPSSLSGWPVGLGVSLGVAAVAYLLLDSVASAVRGLALTPERGAIALATAVALLPFALSFHALLRRGGRGVLLRVVGRGATLAALAIGLALGVFGEGVAMRALLPTYAMLEVVFSAYYLQSTNPLPAAALESLWVGWILAAVVPVSL